jgi:hypothetical protein
LFGFEEAMAIRKVVFGGTAITMYKYMIDKSKCAKFQLL